MTLPWFGSLSLLVVFVGGIANFLNRGIGLVVGALLAREVASVGRKIDYPVLVAAAYSGERVHRH